MLPLTNTVGSGIRHTMDHLGKNQGVLRFMFPNLATGSIHKCNLSKNILSHFQLLGRENFRNGVELQPTPLRGRVIIGFRGDPSNLINMKKPLDDDLFYGNQLTACAYVKTYVEDHQMNNEGVVWVIEGDTIPTDLQHNKSDLAWDSIRNCGIEKSNLSIRPWLAYEKNEGKFREIPEEESVNLQQSCTASNTELRNGASRVRVFVHDFLSRNHP
jgi:hypothetical protein